TGGLYTVDFSDAELKVLEGKLIFYNITFKPDTTVYNKRNQQHTAPNTLFEFHAKRLILSHIHPFRLYFKHVLNIGQMSLNAPEIKISYLLNQNKDTVTIDHKTLWQKIKPNLKSIHIGNIFLSNVNFKYYDHSNSKVLLTELKEMNLHGSDLLIDSATQTDKSRLFYFKDIVANLNNYKGKLVGGLYTYSIKKLEISTRTSQLNAQGITWEPVKAGLFFNGNYKDRFTLRLDSLQLNNFDFLTYHKFRTLSGSSMILTRGTFEVFNNPNKPQTFNNKISTFPNVAIHGLKTEVTIDTVIVKHINVIYSELNKKSQQVGTISFNNTSGKILNFTNNNVALQKNNLSKIQLTSYFMGHGKLDVSFTFNLTDKDVSYSYKGMLGPMGLQAVNPATVPLAMVKFTSGTLKSFNFDIKGNSKVSEGKVAVLYNDLKVNILRADTANAVLKQKFVASLFANIFILKHNNPDNEGEIPRSFNVLYKRPINSPFFKTAWQTLLIGIKPAVGYDTKTQQMATARMTQGELNKQNRKIKKKQRIEKRAERKLKREIKQQQKEAEKSVASNGQ
ncbi:hypothetical protein, partial [Mucilaginibacter sp.]|uniref:hypothetical protein n=1 Tax=Mucilaginibacter sp. TaxID=1882438 RepID=UPI0026275259